MKTVIKIETKDRISIDKCDPTSVNAIFAANINGVRPCLLSSVGFAGKYYQWQCLTSNFTTGNSFSGDGAMTFKDAIVFAQKSSDVVMLESIEELANWLLSIK